MICGCAICGAWVRQWFLCAACRDRIFQGVEPRTRHFPEFVSKSLFSWRPNGISALDAVMAALKRKSDADFWRPFAVSLTLYYGQLSSKTTLVPVPSLRENHALGLAKALQSIHGCQLVDGLQVTRRIELKNLNRLEREQQLFKLENSCRDYRDVVIVDDIVTTGATARAAFQALGRPQSCQVWCLSDRRPCGERRPLL